MISAETPIASHRDEGEDQHYRSLSSLAVGGLILGLASAAFIAAPTLVIVPLAAIAVSTIALRRIAANPEVLAGRVFAICGLLLAVVSSTAGFTKTLVVERLLAGQAEPVSRAWIDAALAGDIQEAHWQTLEPGKRKRIAEGDSSSTPRPSSPPSPGGPPTPEPPTIAEEVEAYAENPAIVALGELEGVTAVDFVENDGPDWMSFGRIRLAQVFRLISDDGRLGRLTVVLERIPLRRDGAGLWRVANAVYTPDSPRS
ncbi:MAG: hypothetical protein AAGF31_04275 [Planctomycetota bacterium]